MPVHAVSVVRYPTSGPYTTEEIRDPAWEAVERHIRAMHPYGQPIVTLRRGPEDSEPDCMMINGGADAFHVQCRERRDCWMQAVNVGRGTEEVEVWTSDQGFVTEARYTWPLEGALALARKYFEGGVRDVAVPWDAS